MTKVGLLELLGKDKNSSDIKEFLLSLGETCLYEEVDDESFHECKESGLELKFTDNRLVAIFLYGDKEENFETYAGEIPLGVGFDWSRVKVRQKLGLPSKSGHAKAFKVLPESVWDRYDFKEFLMNITYSSPDCLSIKRISLMPPNKIIKD